MKHVHTLPGFSHALTSWQDLLREEGYSGNVLWIFHEDITWHDGKFFIRLPLPEVNQSFVTQLYERGCEKGLGVMLSLFCFIGDDCYCYIWIPKDVREAELALLAGLKFSIPSKPPTAQSVLDEHEWRQHTQLGQHQGAATWLNHLPNRS
jgi:hypothetical protein